jgi:hypothetical protein
MQKVKQEVLGAIEGWGYGEGQCTRKQTLINVSLFVPMYFALGNHYSNRIVI